MARPKGAFTPDANDLHVKSMQRHDRQSCGNNHPPPPPHDVNSRLLCSEFHARMAQVNSKCSSVQLRANSTIYSRDSRRV